MRIALNYLQVAPREEERPANKTIFPTETPGERAIRKYYDEGAGPEAIAEENELAAAFSRTAGEVNANLDE